MISFNAWSQPSPSASAAAVDRDRFRVTFPHENLGSRRRLFAQEKFHLEHRLGRTHVTEIAIKGVDGPLQNMSRVQLARGADDILRRLRVSQSDTNILRQHCTGRDQKLVVIIRLETRLAASIDKALAL